MVTQRKRGRAEARVFSKALYGVAGFSLGEDAEQVVLAVADKKVSHASIQLTDHISPVRSGSSSASGAGVRALRTCTAVTSQSSWTSIREKWLGLGPRSSVLLGLSGEIRARKIRRRPMIPWGSGRACVCVTTGETATPEGDCPSWLSARSRLYLS